MADIQLVCGDETKLYSRKECEGVDFHDFFCGERKRKRERGLGSGNGIEMGALSVENKMGELICCAASFAKPMPTECFQGSLGEAMTWSLVVCHHPLWLTQMYLSKPH